MTDRDALGTAVEESGRSVEEIADYYEQQIRGDSNSPMVNAAAKAVRLAIIWGGAI